MSHLRFFRFKNTTLLLIAVCFTGFPAYAQYSGGTGEPNDPYQIAKAEDLMLLGETPEDYDKHFILTADIDMHPNLPGRNIFNTAVIGSDPNVAFTGVFDGDGYTISHLTIEGMSYLGLFGQLGSEATVKNLGLDAVYVFGTGHAIGCLGGDNWGNIVNCYCTGTVRGEQGVGGLVGSNGGSIITSHSTGTISGTGNSVGGLVGGNSGAISECYAKGSVSGMECVGGLAGENRSDGIITRCFAICTVQADESGGGLVGLNAGFSFGARRPGGPFLVAIVYDCYSILMGDCRVSGLLVGQNGKPMGMLTFYYPSLIANCYASCDDSGRVETSGLVGLNYWGTGSLGIINCFWDVEATKVAENVKGGTPKTTVQMHTIGTFFGWGGLGDEFIWTIDEGQDYPRLNWENKPGQVIKPIFLSDFLSGAGTEDDPFLIYTTEELNLVGRGLHDWDKHFKLMADIDLSGYEYRAAVIARDFYDTPSRSYYDSIFTGVFDGNGHTLSNLTIAGVDYVGLFRKLGDGAEVRNLGIVDANIIGDSLVGGFVGYNDGGNILNSFITGTVSGEWDVGGLVGDNRSGNIVTCYSNVKVNGTRDGVGDIGGLVGSNGDAGNIISSYNTGNVRGDRVVGGLVGRNGAGSITECYNTGSIIGNSYVGGLAGISGFGGGNITNCFNTGTVSGQWNVGGLVGHNTGGIIGTSFNSGSVSGELRVGGLIGQNRIQTDIIVSYNTGMVTGDRVVGGLVGSNGGVILMSYNTGTVIGERDVGGLVGDNNDFWGNKRTVIDCFWDIESSGRQTSDGGTGKMTAEMQDISTYVDAGWDFTDETIHGTCDYWKMSPGEYPQLNQPVMPEGLGTVEQPYVIRDAQDLGTLWFEPRAHYRLEDSIDLLGIDWSMAVVPRFDGIFDGNDLVISNLHIEGVEYLGLFGQLGPGAEIVNLGLEAVDVNGTGDEVGGLAGRNRGSIAASYSAGKVAGDERVGGLVGWNRGSIATSYSAGMVTGDESVGGLVGSNSIFNYGASTITASYSTSTVSGISWSAGGLVGNNYKGTITKSYSAGMVTGDLYVGGLLGRNDKGDITASFWDMETSGQTKSDGGIGKTTAEMQTAGTFLETGWDFVDETANGTEDIWWILEGQDYPRLWWEAK